MFDTSKDVLNIMLGSSVLIVALLFAWLLYQSARTLKGLNDAMSSIQNLVRHIDEGVKNFKDKAGNAAAFLTVLIKSAQSIIETVGQKRSSSKAKKQK